MNNGCSYDVAIIGGGLAGLSAAITLARADSRVILFERHHYPFHRVCGEYISMESWNYLEGLGLPLSQMNVPRISRLRLSAPNGKMFQATLPQGGFGLSRYSLDHYLSQIAVTAGVELVTDAKITAVERDSHFLIRGNNHSGAFEVRAAFCCGAFGKKSNLDRGEGRQSPRKEGAKNYVGVKYHVRIDRPEHEIAMHNFKDGYCGLSKIEHDLFCLCYMTTADQLKAWGSIPEMEKNLLSRNPQLKEVFEEAAMMPGFPVTISGIQFHNKSKVEKGMLMIGDAAGMITPLCGNGMSIALHTGSIAASCIKAALEGRVTVSEMEENYCREWKRLFALRLRTGRAVQRFFGGEGLSNVFVSAFRTLPFLASPLIRMTHGRPF